MQWQTFNFDAIEPVRWSNLGVHKKPIVIGALLVIGGIVSIPVLVYLFVSLWDLSNENTAGWLARAIGFISMPLVLVGTIVIATTWSRAVELRIYRFVGDNKGKISYAPAKSFYSANGALFYTKKRGRSSVLVSEFSGSFSGNFWFGNVIRGGRSAGYVRMTLPRRLPHMIVDAVKNNPVFGTNLPIIIKKNQGLSLEGDFDDHYRLYVPKQYERDALYVFTPDIMSLLVRAGAKYDVEIIGNQLYLYHNRKFNFMDRYSMQQVLWLIEGLGEKIRRRVDAYRDDRVDNAKSANQVALDGRELYRMEKMGVTFENMSVEKQKTFIWLVTLLGTILALAVGALILVIVASSQV